MGHATVAHTVLRFALRLWLLDPRCALTPAQRAWLTARLDARTPLPPTTVAKLYPPLLAYWRAAHPSSLEIIARIGVVASEDM